MDSTSVPQALQSPTWSEADHPHRDLRLNCTNRESAPQTDSGMARRDGEDIVRHHTDDGRHYRNDRFLVPELGLNGLIHQPQTPTFEYSAYVNTTPPPVFELSTGYDDYGCGPLSVGRETVSAPIAWRGDYCCEV